MAAEGDQNTEPRRVDAPFQVGISGYEIDFGNSDERERWLRTQPVEVAMVIAARAALRSGARLSLARGSTGSRLTRRRMICVSFERLMLHGPYQHFRDGGDALNECCEKSAVRNGDLQATPAERAARML